MSELDRVFSKRNAAPGSGDSIAQREIFNPYSEFPWQEFPELSRKEIKESYAMFKKYDTSGDGFLDLLELKYLMEKLGAAQTHVALKAMIKEVDEDNDGQMSMREFMLVFVKATKGELQSAGLNTLAKQVDVQAEGVGGAKGFFEAHIQKQTDHLKNEQEIKAEQAEKRKERAAAAERKAAFKAKHAVFQ